MTECLQKIFFIYIYLYFRILFSRKSEIRFVNNFPKYFPPPGRHHQGSVKVTCTTTITGPVKIPESNDLCLYPLPSTWCHRLQQSHCQPPHCQTKCWCFEIFPPHPPPTSHLICAVEAETERQDHFHLNTKYVSLTITRLLTQLNHQLN